MEPTPPPQQLWWPSPTPSAQSGSDRHWDATMRLLALGDDAPLSGRLESKREEDAAVAALLDPQAFRFEEGDGAFVTAAEAAGTVGKQIEADRFALSASLSEEDINFIVSSASDDATELSLENDSNAAVAAAVDPEIARRSAQRRSAAADSAAASTARATGKAGTKALAMTLPGVLSSAEEARRERNRLKVRRLYYRKLDRLNALRTEMTNLEEHVESLTLARHCSNSTSAGSPDALAASTQSTAKNLDYAALLDQLATAKQQLQHENEYMRQLVSQYIRSVHAISVKLMALSEPPTAYLKIKSVTRLECADMRRRTLKEVLKFTRTRGLFKDVGSICGWHSMQIVDDGIFRFNVEKHVPHIGADDVAARTWAVVRDPPQFARLHSTAVEMKCFLLQEIDDDNVVMFHEHRAMNTGGTHALFIRTIVLLSRVRTASGHVITLRSLDRSKWILEDLSSADETIVWNDLFCWLQYKDAGGGDCACTFAGFAAVVGSVQFWMIEIVQLAVRWESMVIGPAGYSLKVVDDDSPSGRADP